MTTLTYPIVCPSCNGAGFINNPQRVCTEAQIVCPACNGTKVVIATATMDDDFRYTLIKKQ
jgi:DnaJ-class molecular chaperone